MTWQPIETAPMDGDTEVDLWADERRWTDCHYHRGQWLMWDTFSVDVEPHWIVVVCPTHWMPLPEGPKQ